MKEYIEERAIEIANYIIEEKSDSSAGGEKVRGLSKSTDTYGCNRFKTVYVDYNLMTKQGGISKAV